MKSKITNDDGITLVELSGYLDFESARPFAETITRLYEDDRHAKVVISLQGLEFVGSSGISSFVKAMKSFNIQSTKPAYCGVKAEFQRLFRLFEDAEPFAIFSNSQEARVSALLRFNEWQAAQERSKATH
jgi:anti-sigma B factor antagonist